ncbi:MAG: DNA recombination protein RmuC [Syntrophobacteraceae bacterium CG07_land_8_20_14_0_80_61_8]|nr:MAG: DNA recombination protein RmuC [Syntrophobacteraceae bacterium CG07_land_8_20_14_0_80_61_8]
MTVALPPSFSLWLALVLVITGLATGVAGIWLLFARRRRILTEQQLRLQIELTGAAQRLQDELKQCRAGLDAGREELTDLRRRLLKETEMRAAFQQAAQRANQLETAHQEGLNIQNQLREQISRLKEERATVQEQLAFEQQAGAEKIQALTNAHAELRASFQNLAADALKSNNTMFLDLARTTLDKYQVQAQNELRERHQSVEALLAPLQQVLANYEQGLLRIERDRQQAYGKLTTQAELLNLAQAQLQLETSKLVRALGQPQVRGRWGEITLKRVVELAGMIEHCDFVVQAQVATEAGSVRPDMLVYLPAKRIIAIDSKVPLRAYLDAMESLNEEERLRRLREHSRRVRVHLQQLGSKQYWSQFSESPEFVVLFLPGEAFFSAALEHDPQLIEYGVEQKVILATPTTLIALLKSVAYGWQRQHMAENATAICALGKTLNSRLVTMVGHFQDLGKQLRRSTEAYNGAMGTFERRVLVSARKLAELGTGSGDAIAEILPVEAHPRALDEPRQSQEIHATDEEPTDVE